MDETGKRFALKGDNYCWYKGLLHSTKRIVWCFSLSHARKFTTRRRAEDEVTRLSHSHPTVKVEIVPID